MTQSDSVLFYLRLHGSITQAEASRTLACSRLGARIYDLKARGHQIGKIMVQGKNRFGEPTHWAKYILIKEANQ